MAVLCLVSFFISPKRGIGKIRRKRYLVWGTVGEKIGSCGDGAELSGSDEPLDLLVILWGAGGESEVARCAVLICEIEDDCVGVCDIDVAIGSVVYNGWNLADN